MAFAKMIGFDQDMCPDTLPDISSDCNQHGKENGDELGQCVQQASLDMMTKIQGSHRDRYKIKQGICDKHVLEDACLDIIKSGCNDDDLNKVKNYMNKCLEQSAQQSLGVTVDC